MKKISMLMWVTQFGVSTIVPLCAMLLLGSWLELGFWGMAGFAAIGALASFSTARTCLRAMRKETENGQDQPGVAFNDHE